MDGSTTESGNLGLLIAALLMGSIPVPSLPLGQGAYLLCNNKYMSAVVDEQKNLMKKHGNKVDHDILSEMEVLYRCIKEALRLHPPLIMLLRMAVLGEPFAYLQIKAIWSHLLRNFEFELISPFPEIDWNAMVVGVKGNVMVKYKRRKLSTE
ncbi:hypothetical protein HAX54_004455 [Datura stramonium]|uniref:Uncharacterized protein n=1 Tax=Datura stramonium TaxID=4076 RepID=A0ABS8T8D0_DATST|nr:hypothetical protein [Datura stramonium]